MYHTEHRQLPLVVSSWSAIQSVGQIIAMTTMHFLSDRYGRRIAMFTLWFILALVGARLEGHYAQRYYL
jgi:MFS family permease